MLGHRLGIQVGPRVGVAVGVSSNEIGPDGGAFTGFGLIWGQSHAQGPHNLESSGTTISGGDPGPGYRTPFATTQYAQDWANAPADPQVWTSFGTTSLQPYQNAGLPNLGIVQSLGRGLNTYLGIASPIMIDCAISSSSIPGHWLPGVFPTTGEKVYTHIVNFVNAKQAAFGRKLEFIIHQIGETDAGTPARVLSAVSDYTTFYTNLRNDCGLGNIPVIISLIHTSTVAPADVPGYRAAQQSYIDANPGVAYAMDFSNILLENGNHFIADGYDAAGYRALLKIRDIFLPGRSLDLNATRSFGGSPWYQGGIMGYTAQSGTGGSGTNSRPQGWGEPKVGDIEVLVAHGFLSTADPGAPTLIAGHDAGFTLLLTQDSVVSTNHRRITIWTRTITQTMLDARTADPDGVKRGACERPQVDFGLANANFATIHCIRGSSGIGASASGANNAATASCVVPTMTTQAGAGATSLILICSVTNGANGSVSSITNANLSNKTKGRESMQFNPGTSVINMSMYWATAPGATALGSITVNFAGASLVAAAAIEFKP